MLIRPTHGLLRGRWLPVGEIAEQYLEALKELQPKTFGSAFVVKTASLLGVRDSRRIEGDYTFTFQDWLERKHLKMRSDVIVTILMFINRGIKRRVTKKANLMEFLIVA